MEQKDLLLVLGFGRSGTSALTRVISLCGCSLPESVFGATNLNPTGHWESVESTNFNVQFASRLGITGDPCIRLADLCVDQSVRRSYIRRIEEFLAKFFSGSVVIKDFQINELMEFWLEAAHNCGFTAKAVIALRHPQEVFASVRAGAHSFAGIEPSSVTTAPEVPIEKINTFWLKINLLAERHSRGLPRVFVEYSNLMKDWRTEVERISRALSCELTADQEAIDRFLSGDLHRQRYSGPVTETFAYSWITRVYGILSSAAQDRPIDFPSLDEIYNGYCTNARAFRLSMEAVDTSAEAQRLSKFVDRLPVWRSKQDF